MTKQAAGILVVDDERFFREAIGEILSGAGHRVCFAECGQDALDRVGDPGLGVVILDIRLPDVDGIQVLARIRELRPSLRVIMLSASTDQELVLEALRLGASDYLAKPLHDEELVLAVGRALDGFGALEDWGRLRRRLEGLVAGMEELAAEVFPLDGDERRSAIERGVARVAAEVLGAEKTSLLRHHDAEEGLRVAAAVGSPVPVEQMEQSPLGERVAGMALDRSEPFVVADIASDPVFARLASQGRYQSGSFAVSPVLYQGRAIGVLCATDRPDGQAFGADDLALLRLLAMQAGELLGALDEGRTASVIGPDEETHAGWMVDSGGQLPEVLPKEDDEGARDAELARQICEATTLEVEPDRILAAVLQTLSRGLPAAPVALYLRDPGTGELRREAECDGGVSSDRAALDPEVGLTGQVLRSGQLVATDDPASDHRFDAQTDTPENGQERPMLCLPLVVRGKSIGVFRAFLQDGALASPSTGEVLAAALSAAVRSVLLYRSLVDTIEEVAEARRSARR